jgi:Ca2+-binding RTX toxin-like protein
MAVAQTTSNLVSDTVNFSGVASDVTATFGAANQTVTGGSGDDTFTFGTNYTSADTIDGGDGNDRLVLDPAATVAVA